LSHRQIALRGVGNLKFTIRDAGVFLEFFRTLTGRLVERAIKLAAKIIDDGRQKIFFRGAGS
jgi:hypothetical protein